MTEIKKLTKISLVVLGIVTLLYGILLVFLLDLFLTPMTGWTNPLHPRMFGGVCFMYTIFVIISLRQKEWEKIQLLYAFLFGSYIMMIVMELIVTALVFPTLSEAAISQVILDQILMCALLAFGIVCYLKQRS